MNPDLKQRLSLVYQEISSPDRLHEILKQFYLLLSQDILVGFFFDHKNLDEIAQKQAAFLLRAMGTTNSYQGLPPAQAHLKLAKILDGHFDRRIVILKQVLQNNGLSQPAIDTWIEFESLFRTVIVS